MRRVVRERVATDDLSVTVSVGLRDRKVIADVGAGAGARAAVLAAEGHRIVAIDVNERRMSALREASQDMLPIVGDALSLPLRDRCIDGILCLETLEHVGDWKTAVIELARVTRPNGALVLSVPTVRTERLFRRLHRNWCEMSGHLEVVNECELEMRLGQSGWLIESKRPVHGAFTLMWLILAPLQTPFDDTGSPLRYRALQRLYWAAWKVLGVFGLRRHVERVVDRCAPKSNLYVCRRVA